MKIFITGATGYIGGRLAKKLADDGNYVHALVRDPNNSTSLSHPNIQIFKGDLNNIPSIQQAIEGCEQVYHCGAYAKLWARDRSEVYKINLEGTNNILEQSANYAIKKVVFTSSTAVLGQSRTKPLTEKDPRWQALENDYDLSKFLAEQRVKEYTLKGLNCVIVNPSRVYGPGNFTYTNTISKLLLDVLKGKRIVIPDAGECRGNYAFIDDIVNGHIQAMNFGSNGERYILGGENISYNQFLEIVTDIIGKPHTYKLPLNILKAAGVLQLIKAKITGCIPAYTPNMLDRYFKNTTFSCDKAIEHLGYQITPFKTGIEKTINYLKQNAL